MDAPALGQAFADVRALACAHGSRKRGWQRARVSDQLHGLSLAFEHQPTAAVQDDRRAERDPLVLRDKVHQFGLDLLRISRVAPVVAKAVSYKPDQRMRLAQQIQKRMHNLEIGLLGPGTDVVDLAASAFV